jgi:phosphoglycerate kinase
MVHNVPSIADRTDLRGKYVLVRSSLNVPMDGGVVRNTFRIEQALPTIDFLRKEGARVILVSHIGKDGTESLSGVARVLSEHFTVTLSPEVTGEKTTQLRDALQDSDVLLLENVRRDERELSNDLVFAHELAALADIYVNDDFAASHRAHASLTAICGLLPSYAGLTFIQECEELLKVMAPQSPSLFLLGGAKFDTKMPLVEKYLSLYDNLFIGGALANDVFKAKGYEVGTSLTSEMELRGHPILYDAKVLLPVDVLAVSEGGRRYTAPEDVHPDESILDVGPATIEMLSTYIQNAATILWNGPLGNYENGYKEQTLACAKAIASAGAYSVVGGGDTVAAIEELGLMETYGFLSTAGGAMLTFLEEGTLIALEALKKSPR